MDARAGNSAFTSRHTLRIRGLLAGLFVAAMTVSAYGAQERSISSVEREFTSAGRFDAAGSLQEYVTFALRNNPGLRASFYEWKAELSRSGEASSLPDPVLSFGYFVENVETRVGPQVYRLSLKQTFPWFGTLSSRKEIVLKSARVSYNRFLAAKALVILEVKNAWLDYYLLGRKIEIVNEEIELLENWESVARTRYSSSSASYRELIMAEIELASTRERLRALERKVAPAAERIRAALDLPGSEEIPFPGEVGDDGLPAEKEAIGEIVLKNNPGLLAAGQMVEKERAAIRLAGKGYYPMFTLGIDYINVDDALDPLSFESGKDPWGLSLSMNLPLWFSKTSSRKASAEARLEMNIYEKRKSERDLLARTDKVISEFLEAGDRIRFLGVEMVPRTEQLLTATWSAYQSGKADFLELVQAQRQLIRFRLEYEEGVVTRARKIAELRFLAGSDV